MKQKIFGKDMIDIGVFSSESHMNNSIGKWTKFLKEMGEQKNKTEPKCGLNNKKEINIQIEKNIQIGRDILIDQLKKNIYVMQEFLKILEQEHITIRK